MTKDEALAKCEAKQYSDQMHCEHCNLSWDMNDPWSPDCAKIEQVCIPQEPVAWECFLDPAYYDMWAIRQTGNRNFEETIHVVNGKEAKHLCAWLNSLNTHPAPSWQGLTFDEINSIIKELSGYDTDADNYNVAVFVEEALKNKNANNT